MDQVKKFFPLSFRGKELKDLIISIIIYVVAEAIIGVVLGILGAIPVVGIITGILGTLVGLYVLAGIVLAILNFCKVID